MAVLGEYHAALGDLVFRFEGTLERFTGDGLMVVFNDPMPCEDAGLRAIRMAVAMRTRVRDLADSWSRQGHDLGFGVGIAQGYATLGQDRVRGPLRVHRHRQRRQSRRPVVRGRRKPWQILVTQRVLTGAEDLVVQHAGRRSGAERLQPARARRSTSRVSTRLGSRREHHRCRARRHGDVVSLSDLDDEQRYQRFDRLQRNMPRVWDAMRLNLENESVVVIPSVTLDRLGERAGRMTQAYEERFLFLLLLLREPRLRMVYVTSTPIAPTIVEYYLALLPGVIPSHAHARLTLVSVGDGTPRPLSQKLLERPRLLRRIAALIPDRSLCHLIPYNTTELERDIAVALGIPMYGADPRLVHLGTKTGCRRLFAEEGVRHPLGHEDLHDPRRGRRRRGVDARSNGSTVSDVIVKLNEGVSGQGNALVDLRGAPRRQATRRSAVEIIARLRQMQFERPDTPLDAYLGKLAERGGIVEELISGVEIRSPSVQLRVTPSGEVELLSTHDQVLGGPSGQSYLGCRFPADFSYAPAISAEASIIGARLAREGVIGRFAIDFVSVRNAERQHGRRTRSSSTFARAARRIRSSRCSSSPAVATTRRTRPLPDPRRCREAPRRDRPPGVGQPPRADGRGSLRHRRPAPSALRSVAPGGSRVPHDQLRDGAWSRGADGGRQHAGRGGGDVPAGGAHAAGRGASGAR